MIHALEEEAFQGESDLESPRFPGLLDKHYGPNDPRNHGKISRSRAVCISTIER